MKKKNWGKKSGREKGKEKKEEGEEKGKLGIPIIGRKQENFEKKRIKLK